MSRTSLYLLGSVLLFLSGCAALDTLTGVNPDGTADPGGGPLGSGANLLGSFVPWAGALLGAAGTLYSQVRRKKYADALHSVVTGVHAVRMLRSKTGEINIQDKKLAQILSEIQGPKSRKLVNKSLRKIERETVSDPFSLAKQYTENP